MRLRQAAIWILREEACLELRGDGPKQVSVLQHLPLLLDAILVKHQQLLRENRADGDLSDILLCVSLQCAAERLALGAIVLH